MVAAVAVVSSPQELLAQPPTTFVAPGRLFAVDLPAKWEVKLTDSPYEYQFVPRGHGDAILYVRRIIVPRGASPKQMALRAAEEHLAALPAFKLLKKRKVTVGGHIGAAVLGTYAYQGNIQYPRVVEEIYIVVGTEAFVFHFDAHEVASAAYAVQLNKFYGSFIPRPADGSGVFDTDPKDPFPDVKNVPF